MMEDEKPLDMSYNGSRGDGYPKEDAEPLRGTRTEPQELKTEDTGENEPIDGQVALMQPPLSEASEPQTTDMYGETSIASVQSGVSAELEDQIGSPCVDEPLTPATDNSSSKSQPGSGRVTPASQSDQSLYMSSSEKGTPARKRKSTDSGVRQIDFDNQSTSAGIIRNPRFPFRAGISWRKGERLEAMDFMHKWFPAKIREINEEDITVLIHFDGWNQRFDEWVDMASDRIRPLIRHSERKDRSKRLKSVTEHRVGEQVYAKWTDCKMYPAKITSCLSNGSYEVIFYDGFKKQVQPINIRPMPVDFNSKAFDVVPETSSIPRKRVKKASSTVTGQSSGQTVRSPPIQKPLSDTKGRPKSSGRSRSKKNKVIPMEQFVPKDLLNKDEGTDHGVLAMASIKSEPVSTQTDYMEAKIEIKEEATTPDLIPTPSVSVNVTQPLPSEPVDVKPPAPVQMQVPQVLPPKAFVVESDHNQYKCHYENCNKGFRKEHLLEYHIKYYHMEETETLAPQPTKRRKKTISVCSSESDSTPLGKKPVIKKPRNSSSDTLPVRELKQEVKEEVDDSYMLMAGRIKQETGEISTQTMLVKQPDVGDDSLRASEFETLHQRTMSQDSILTEESSCTDMEEFLKPDELVNCICDFYEENGLMIQCEVCLCWQHASCFGITERTLPKTYVCFVCENPPGVRESSRYIHEQDWLKLGEISAFNYLPNPQGTEERCNAIRQTHSLMAEMHQLNRVLHSLKLQLKILRSKDEQKLKLWRMDWDVIETFPDSSIAVSTTEGGYTEQKTTEPETSTEGKTSNESHNVLFTLSSNNDAVDETIEVDKMETSVTDTVNTEKLNGTENTEKQNGADGPEDATADVKEISGVSEVEVSDADSGNKTNDQNNLNDVKDQNDLKDSKDQNDLKDAKDQNDLKDASAAEEHTTVVRDDEVKDGGRQLNDSAEVPEQRSTEADQEDATHSDSTESVVEDPIEMYERNLLNHIQRVQTEIDERMDKIEEQVSMLESFEAANSRKEAPAPDQIMADFPQLKKTTRILHNDLFKVKKMAVFH